MEDLADLQVVVRRVIAARVRQPQLVDDLTQETLAQLAAADIDLDAGARQGYAIAAARNIVTSHLRRVAVSDRHVHLLVDDLESDGPERAALINEEAAALTEALRHLPADERELLVRHEVDGDDVAAIARDSGATAGATTMRLARARARLRLEFVLTFRRIQLPTSRCRPVLLALAAGDRRQQRRVGSAAHLAACPTCAQLASPVSERRRGIAAWLIVPAAEGLRRLARSLRHNHVTQAGFAAVVISVAAVGFNLTRSDPSAETAPPPATVASLQRSPTTSPPPPPTTPPAAPVTTLPVCAPAAALDELQPSPVLGCPVGSTALTVTAVPSDEGFWGQTATGREVWVQLIGTGESPFDVTLGLRVVVTGTTADPAGSPEVVDDPRAAELGFVLHVTYDQLTPG